MDQPQKIGRYIVGIVFSFLLKVMDSRQVSYYCHILTKRIVKNSGKKQLMTFIKTKHNAEQSA